MGQWTVKNVSPLDPVPGLSTHWVFFRKKPSMSLAEAPCLRFLTHGKADGAFGVLNRAFFAGEESATADADRVQNKVLPK